MVSLSIKLYAPHYQHVIRKFSPSILGVHLASCETGRGRIVDVALSDIRIAVASNLGVKIFELTPA